ncbi:YicC/YloC family endoribonuclease [Athalassotoga sp.]|uniref:YicC/YloC family endoribonuclease n=1 Tax=Athalassotoga sp. TaxID=2022597 RepID=UPI003D052A97
MTGYSKVNKNINDVFYTVEMKGVNHKYLNISFFLPYLFSSFEARSLPIVQSEIKRGSISIKIDIRGNFESSLVIPDLELAKSYFKAFKEIEREIGVELRLDLGQLLEIKDIFKMSLDIQTEDKIWEGFQTVLTEAIENYNKSREAEGEKLRVYLEDQMVSLDEIMKKMNTYESQNREKYKEMILQSLKDNFSEIQMDPQRIEQEVIMTIQRADIGEEISRVFVHMSRARELMKSKADVGSELDFIFQEIGREINTLSAKSKIPEVLSLVVESKTIVKKLREQVQNIE